MTFSDTTSRETGTGVLAGLRDVRAEQRRLEAEEIRLAVTYAAFNSAESIHPATVMLPGTERVLRLAGDGAPEVAEFAVVELAAALGRGQDYTRAWLGGCLELVHRLPILWGRVQSGQVAGWQALRIAGRTHALPPAGASWVDVQVAPVAGKIGPAALDALEDRRVDITLEHILDGGTATAHVAGVLDAADALDLEAAITGLAEQLAELGSKDSLDVRRAKALGELARGHHTLPLAQSDGDGEPQAPSTARPHRQVVLHVHLAEAALHGIGHGIATLETVHGVRDLPVTVEQIQDWCAGAQVTVKPVLDLAQRLECNGYTPSDVLREQVVALTPRCAHPYCERPARSADIDHNEAHADGGPTASDNLAPLCRLHHRAKTHGGWTYTTLAPGEHLWRSRTGMWFHVGPDGTTALPDHDTASPETGPPRPRPRP